MGWTPPTFNVQAFRSQYTQFTSGVEYPDTALQNCWNTALVFLPQFAVYLGQCPAPSTPSVALSLMTAHIALLNGNAANGQVPGVVVGATIEKVTVVLQPPPEKSQWQWWLNQTSYGQQLLALLQVKTVGGLYAGGSLDLAAFRRPGGIY